MNFATFSYWIFLFICISVLHVLPARWQKGWLIFASAVFYASWSVPYLGLLMGAATFNYLGARWIAAAPGDRAKRGRLIIGGNLLVLIAFKYATWLGNGFTSIFALIGWQVAMPAPRWALPLGISFYLFESMSYIIDLVRKREKLHPYWSFFLFILFFPKLIAGPILRAKEFLPQLDQPLRPTAIQLRYGIRQIVFGLFLKVVLADGYGALVDDAFARPMDPSTCIDAWIMAIGFCVHVYFDFSAYTRMAIGSAALCGISLVENFDHPFIATSPPEFWRRWHMSLSRWVRDYVFYPMAQHTGPISGSPARVALFRRWMLIRAAFMSMLIFGIWHGAGWTFVIYGALNGTALSVYHLATHRDSRATAKSAAPARFVKLRAFAGSAIGWLFTFTAIGLAFAIFRAPTVKDARLLCAHALNPFSHPGRTLPDYVLVRIAGGMAAVLAIGWALGRQEGKTKPLPAPQTYWAAAAEGVVLGVLLVFGLIYMTGGPTFVYFQF